MMITTNTAASARTHRSHDMFCSGPGLPTIDLYTFPVDLRIPGDDTISLLCEIGYTKINDVPIERAYFDSCGFGPYDRNDL